MFYLVGLGLCDATDITVKGCITQISFDPLLWSYLELINLHLIVEYGSVAAWEQV